MPHSNVDEAVAQEAVDLVERDGLEAGASQILQLTLEERHRQRQLLHEMIVIVRDAVVGDDGDLRRRRHAARSRAVPISR